MSLPHIGSQPRASSSSVVRLDLPATTAHLSVLCACITAIMERVERLDDPEVAAYNVQLAANEIFANIVGHAYAGTRNGRVAVTISLLPSPRRIAIELRDQGESFDLTTVPAPDLDDAQVHGYGLFLANQLMDHVSYQPQAGNNSWQLVKYL